MTTASRRSRTVLLAAASGINVRAMSVLFAVLIGLTAAQGVQIVGALLIISLVITPGAAAAYVTASPMKAVALSVLFAETAAVGGVLLLRAQELNAFAVGEENARHVGVDVRGVRMTVLVCVSVLIGVCVSIGGAIGFGVHAEEHLAARSGQGGHAGVGARPGPHGRGDGVALPCGAARRREPQVLAPAPRLAVEQRQEREPHPRTPGLQGVRLTRHDALTLVHRPRHGGTVPLPVAPRPEEAAGTVTLHHPWSASP